MRTLSKLHVDLIRGDLRQSGVELRDLEDDLLDHLCCLLESGSENRTFEEIYSSVKEEFFPEGYRQIQNETNYLLTLKYKSMKKTMNVLGIAGSAILLLGSIMKLQSMLGSNEAILLGGIILVLGYLPLMLIMSLKQTDTNTGKFRNISGYIGGAAVITGIVFNLLYITGGKGILITGLGILLILFVPLFLMTVGKEAVMKIHPVTSAVLIIAIVSTLFAFNNKKSSTNFRISLAELNNNISRSYNIKRERLLSLRNVSESEKISTTAEDALLYIDNLKRQILDAYEVQASGLELREDFVLEGHELLLDFMLKENQNYKYNGVELYEKVKDFNSALKAEYPDLDNTLMNTVQNKTWIDSNFSQKPFFSVYSTLSHLQLQIADLEMEALRKSK